MKRTENEAKRYQTFEDLEVYQVAREFRKMMYLVARLLPEQDLFFGRLNASSLQHFNE